MRSVVRTLLVLVAIVATVLAAGGPNAARAADPPQLVAQRAIEIPGTRIIALSPDGTAIAASDFEMNRLCIYEVETLAERACADLAPLEAGLRLEDVVWSPDSSKLALAEQSFVRFVDGDLWVMDAATGELTDLTDDGVNARIPFGQDDPDVHELFVDVSPTWLPDGSGITFSRSTWRDGDWYGNSIATVPVTGGEPKVLTIVSIDTPGVVYYGMRWTADASRLIYGVNYPDNDNPDNGIWSVTADGLGATKLLGSDPVRSQPILSGISPDGATVLAFYPMVAGSFTANEPVYSLLDVPSGTSTPLKVQLSDAPDYVFVPTAVLSPDGRSVLYAARLTVPDTQILIRPVAGGDETVLVPEGLPGAAPIDLTAVISWANDGSVLLNATPSEATILRIEGVTEPVPVPTMAAVPATPAMSPGTPAAPNTEPATPTARTTTIEPGATVTVNDNDVPLRSAPSTGAQTVVTLALGTELTVVGPAVEGDGFTWIPVTDPATGTIGYVRIEFVD